MPKRHLIPVFVPHLGCPNACVFCNQNRITGEIAPATAKTVEDAISAARTIIPEDMAAELAFYGGSFTAIPIEEQEALLSAADDFLCENENNTLRLSTRPDCIDENTLLRLKAHNVCTIELGAQSMCDAVLKASDRGHTAEYTRKAARLIKEMGFQLILQMMTGLPGDTFENTKKTAQEIIALQPDGVRIYPTVVIKDTPLCCMWEKGTYKEHTVKEAVAWCAELVPMFKDTGIEIIRLGLNPSEELSGGAAAAGAYHPAFGQLVYSEIYKKKAEELLKEVSPGYSVVLGVAKGKTSLMVGQKRNNIIMLTETFKLKSLKVKETDVNDDEIVLFSVEKQD